MIDREELDMLLSELKIINHKINEISEQLKKNDEKQFYIEKSLISNLFLNLEDHCHPAFGNEKYKNIPSYIKRTDAIVRLFDNQVWELAPLARKRPNEDWDICHKIKAENTIHMYILSNPFTSYLGDNFHASDVNNFLSSDHPRDNPTERDSYCLSLKKLFNKDYNHRIAIGDEFWLKLFDPDIYAIENNNCRCTLMEVTIQEHCIEIIIKVKYSDYSPYIYKAAMYQGVYYESGYLCFN